MKFFTFQSTPLKRANKMEFNCNPYHQSIKISMIITVIYFNDVHFNIPTDNFNL